MPEKNEQEKALSFTLPVRSETKVEQGYGACSSSGCNCQAYTGNSNTCGNCGHNFATHW